MRTKLLLTLTLLLLPGCGMSAAKRLAVAGQTYTAVNNSLANMADQFDEDEKEKILLLSDTALIYLQDWEAALIACEDPNTPCPEFVQYEDLFNRTLDTLMLWYAKPSDPNTGD